MSVSDYSAAASQLPVTSPLRVGPSLHPSLKAAGTQHGRLAGKTQNTDELRQRFTQFVGETFFGQMIKAMRTTVGKPAYFHGGRAEEVFQGQLDQKLAEHLTEASAEKFAEPMFDRQFPHLNKQGGPDALDQLHSLRRV